MAVSGGVTEVGGWPAVSRVVGVCSLERDSHWVSVAVQDGVNRQGAMRREVEARCSPTIALRVCAKSQKVGVRRRWLLANNYLAGLFAVAEGGSSQTGGCSQQVGTRSQVCGRSRWVFATSAHTGGRLQSGGR